jgi:hypothetical protein
MTPAGIEPATFRFVAERLNRCVTAVINIQWYFKIADDGGTILPKHVAVNIYTHVNLKGRVIPSTYLMNYLISATG